MYVASTRIRCERNGGRRCQRCQTDNWRQFQFDFENVYGIGRPVLEDECLPLKFRGLFGAGWSGWFVPAKQLISREAVRQVQLAEAKVGLVPRPFALAAGAVGGPAKGGKRVGGR